MRTGRPIADKPASPPYKLHRLLREHGLYQSQLRQAIVCTNGNRAAQPLSSSSMSTLLTQRIWPATIHPDDLRAQAAAFLRERGVPEAAIAQAWQVEGDQPDNAPRERALWGEGKRDARNDETFQLPEAEMLSQAAREQFGLARHPFVDDVQGPQDVYLSTDQRYIRESMYYAAKHGGFVAVIGESGSGKSTLRRDLLERLKRDDEPIVVIQTKIVDKREMTTSHVCDAVIADISNEAPRLSKEAKARQVERLLASSARTGVSHVLIIEEAHDLNKNTLRYLKRFWELEDGFKRLLGIILIGQPELGELLDERRNYDIREVIRRIEQARLRPLNGNLEEYLTLKFKRVGVDCARVFDKDAYDAIRARLTRRRHGTSEIESQLYPLVVQNLIIKCLNQCAELGQPRISAEQVRGI